MKKLLAVACVPLLCSLSGCYYPVYYPPAPAYYPPAYPAAGYAQPPAPMPPANGQNCREFTQTIEIGGRMEKAYGTACRQADGSWQNLGDTPPPAPPPEMPVSAAPMPVSPEMAPPPMEVPDTSYTYPSAPVK